MEDENEKLINRYHSLFDEMTSYEQVHSCLLQMDSDLDIDDLRGIFICEMLHPFTSVSLQRISSLVQTKMIICRQSPASFDRTMKIAWCTFKRC